MPATLKIVRELALALPGVEESTCCGTPAFYVNGKLLLRLREDEETLVVRYPKENRDELIDTHPDVFSVTEHYQNYPAVLLNLLAVNRELLAKVIENAWRLRAPKKLVSAFEAKPSQARTLFPETRGQRSGLGSEHRIRGTDGKK